jgi:hypothetical protein
MPGIPFFFLFFWEGNLSFRSQASAERTPPEGLAVEICIYFKIDRVEKKATDGWESMKYIEYTVLHSTRTDWRDDPRHAPNYHQTLFLSSVDSVPILTRNDLYFGGRYLLIRFHLERCIFHQERPHVIAQSVGVEMTLVILWAAEPQEVQNDMPLR